MNNEFDIDNISKRMPYKVEDGFFDDLENGVMAELGLTEEKNEMLNAMNEEPAMAVALPKKHCVLKITSIVTIIAAACIAFVFILKTPFEPTVGMDDIVQAYANLSNSDQDFLIEAYQSDIFLNDIK